MQLHTLKPKHIRFAKNTRVGRGGKRGTTSGRGTKGQRSRTGHRIRPAIRELIRRLPKLRGYQNKPHQLASAVVSVGRLAKLSATTINRTTLIDAGLIRTTALRVKIVSDGEIKRAIQLQGIPASEAAKKKIEAAGGKIS